MFDESRLAGKDSPARPGRVVKASHPTRFANGSSRARQQTPPGKKKYRGTFQEGHRRSGIGPRASVRLPFEDDPFASFSPLDDSLPYNAARAVLVRSWRWHVLRPLIKQEERAQKMQTLLRIRLTVGSQLSRPAWWCSEGSQNVIGGAFVGR